MRRVLSVLSLLVLVVAAQPLLAEDNPFLGTWKLNLAKSKFESAPAPKSQTRTISLQGNGVKYSFEGVGADGTPFVTASLPTMTGQKPLLPAPGRRPGPTLSR